MVTVFLLAALASIVSAAVGRSRTSFVARRTTDPARWNHPLFKEANLVLTLLWAAIFGLSALAIAVGGAAAGLAVAVVNPLLGLASPWLGQRYAAWRASR